MVYGIQCTDYATPFYPQKLALTLPTSGGHSAGIVRSRTQATELVKEKLLWTNVYQWNSKEQYDECEESFEDDTVQLDTLNFYDDMKVPTKYWQHWNLLDVRVILLSTLKLRN
jgi:hypothetical protein